MKLSTLAQVIQAHYYGPEADFSSIAIDSRKIKGGELFVALKGETHDGHDYIAQAIAQGAKAILCARAPQDPKEHTISFLTVEDTTQALGALAAFWRSQYTLPLVGLTGSCGKTSVKGMIESICKQQGKTLATAGNFNNHVGLPLTLLRLDASYQFAVIEMGASGAGEINYLGKLAKPTIALITNVLPAHLQGFGTLADVAKAKGEIYEILSPQGIAVLNIDEPFNKQWQATIGSRKTITYGLNPHAMIRATDIVLAPFQVTFTLHYLQETTSVTLTTPGQHTVMNALAAAAAGFALGLSIHTVRTGLAAFEGVPGRLRRFKGWGGAAIIDDSYNANPGSVKAALEVLAHCQGQRMFVMGDMAELGENTIDYHKEMGAFARHHGIERLFAVGKLSEHAVKTFGEGGRFYPTKEALVDEVKGLLNAQAIILVKGSRSAGMESVTKALILQED